MTAVSLLVYVVCLAPAQDGDRSRSPRGIQQRATEGADEGDGASDIKAMLPADIKAMLSKQLDSIEMAYHANGSQLFESVQNAVHGATDELQKMKKAAGQG